jgi:hypothetical protein
MCQYQSHLREDCVNSIGQVKSPFPLAHHVIHQVPWLSSFQIQVLRLLLQLLIFPKVLFTCGRVSSVRSKVVQQKVAGRQEEKTWSVGSQGLKACAKRHMTLLDFLSPPITSLELQFSCEPSPFRHIPPHSAIH